MINDTFQRPNLLAGRRLHPVSSRSLREPPFQQASVRPCHPELQSHEVKDLLEIVRHKRLEGLTCVARLLRFQVQVSGLGHLAADAAFDGVDLIGQQFHHIVAKLEGELFKVFVGADVFVGFA